MPSKPARRTAPRKHRVLLVDDHPVVREGMTRRIGLEPDLVVCAEAGTPAAALETLDRCPCDAAVVDISLEGRNGIDLIKDIRARHPKMPVLVLSMHDESLYAERALRAGAQGYVMKNEPAKIIVAALRRVLEGGMYISERMTEKITRQFVQRGAAPSRDAVEVLSDRELEVFELIGHGLGTRQVAEKLRLSMKTISCYRQNIQNKLNFANAAELVHHAVHWAKINQID
jgi:DNA-binding NarL/FixJ family response regulator